jgi:hypothetical protein
MMKLKLKEEPKEWRKAAWTISLGLAIFSSLLRWRGVLPMAGCVVLWCIVAALVLAAAVRPNWFRNYYRFSTRLGFVISRMAGYAVLALLFFVVVTPLGFGLRILGKKNPLCLRRQAKLESYWKEVRQETSFERLF